MRKIRDRLKAVIDWMTIIGAMIKQAWHAQPFCFVAMLALQGLQGLMPLATAWITKAFFDLLVSNMQRQMPLLLVPGLLTLLVAQALVTVLGQLVSPAATYFSAELGRQLTISIKSAIYQKINSLVGLTYFEDPQFHNTIEMTSSTAQLAPMQALSTLLSLVQGLVTLLSFLGVLLTLSPLLTLIVGIAVLPQLFIQIKLSRQHFQVVFDNTPKGRLAAYYGRVLAWVAYAKEVRLFNLGDYILRKFLHISREIFESQRGQQFRELRWQVVLSLLSSAVSTSTFLVVVWQAFSGLLSIGDIALYTSAVTNVQGALSSIVSALSGMNEPILFFHKYRELLALEQPLRISKAPRPVPPLAVGITMRNVSFRYSDQHPWVLRQVDGFLPANRCLALVGLNGAGKTTLVKLLTRLYDPTEGQILWDGIDIREFDPGEYRSHLGALFQDFVRYELTVRENIGLGNTARIEDGAAIQKAAIQAGIHKRIETLTHGYQTVLSRWLADEQKGVDLSGGEWQKLALARMFMRNAEIVILDEPTAALDAQAEYELFQHFRELMRRRTCLLITHRFSTVRMADRILVLENGQKVEEGTHEELLAHNGLYAKLYGMQAESYAASASATGRHQEYPGHTSFLHRVGLSTRISRF